MTIVEVTPPESEVAWRECEAAMIRAVSTVNHGVVAIVETIVKLLATGGWMGWGIKSPAHFVSWKANVAAHRAEGFVRIARRRDDLPACWALFTAGALTEDAMVRIARRVPATHDADVARQAPTLLISQLTRVLSVFPPLPDPDKDPDKPPRQSYFRRHLRADGSEHGEYDLPAEQAAIWGVGLDAARDAEFRDRNNLPDDTEVGPEARQVDWADAAVRMAADATDVVDATLQRTGHPGERHQVVLHHHVDHEGRVGPGRLHLGGFLTTAAARQIACDAKVILMAYRGGKLLGIKPTERTPNRKLRRYLEHRDGGCAYPLCVQKRWLHAHHLWHWEDGGPTVAWNLVCFCPLHHRGIHAGDFTVEGNPEDGPLLFSDRFGRRIEPPRLGADPLPPPAAPTYQQPYGGRLITRDFTWN